MSEEHAVDDSLVTGKARTAAGVSDNLTVVGPGGPEDEDPPLLPREEKKNGDKTSVKAEEGEEEEEAGSDEGHADDGDLDENKRYVAYTRGSTHQSHRPSRSHERKGCHSRRRGARRPG